MVTTVAVDEREQRKAAVAERMSDNMVRARLRDDTHESPDDDVITPRPRRRTPELVLGILLVLVGALGGLFVFRGGQSTSTMVAAARELPRGTVISRSDLVAVEVGVVPGGTGVMANEASSLIGMRLLVDLPAGVPIPAHVVTRQRLLTENTALLPIALGRGAVPSGLGRGDFIRAIISFPNRGTDTPSPEVLTEVMEVFDVVYPDDFSDAVRITVVASPDTAIDLARAERIQVMTVAGK
jgi:hypothetical protein